MQHRSSVSALIALAVALSACSAPASLSSPGLAPAQGAQRLLAGAAADKGSQMTFTYTTVDDPSSTVNQVDGIDASSDIAGTVGSGKSNDPYQGYVSSYPYAKFTALKYHSAAGTFASGIVGSGSSQVVVGYVVTPPSLVGIWAFEYVNGIFTLLKNHKGAKGTSTLTELLGVNDSNYAVGTFRTTAGTTAAVTVDLLAQSFTNLKTPGATAAAATGINASNDVAGWETVSSGTEAFFERLGLYYTLSYPGAAVTKALGINSADQIVGYYQKSVSGATHGFVLTNPTKGASGQVWQTIDEPNAASGTVVTGINDSDDICGYFVDSSGVQHGFVAVPGTK